MTQQDRDRLVVLKKALKKLIKQSQAATELNLSTRQVRRLLRRLKKGTRLSFMAYEVNHRIARRAQPIERTLPVFFGRRSTAASGQRWRASI